MLCFRKHPESSGCAQRRHRVAVAACTIAMLMGVPALADPCDVPDDTTGTVSLPPEGCDYLSPSEVHVITNGLPPGTTIRLAPIHRDFICQSQDDGPGGSPHCGVDDGTGSNGEQEVFSSELQIDLQGTGALSDFQRTISMDMFCVTHTDARTPGDAVQEFDTEMEQCQGSLPPGDPDFQSLSIVAGSDNGLPSPGHTTLTRLGPPGSDFRVDSFFDITYRIDFVGAAGGALDGLSGTTTAGLRMAAVAAGTSFGSPVPTVSEWGLIILALLLITVASIMIRRHGATGNGTVATSA